MADLAWLLVAFFAFSTRPEFRVEGIDLPESTLQRTCTLGRPSEVAEIRVTASEHVSLRLSHSLQEHVAQTLAEQDLSEQTSTIEKYFDPSVVEWGVAHAPLTSSRQANPPFSYSKSLENVFRCIDWMRPHVDGIYFSLYADVNLSYPAVKRVVDGLQVRGINRFLLITQLETDPTASI